MALTAEVLRANEALGELSDTQVAAIEALSANDENVVIGQKIGELHGKYDEDILTVSGVEKNQGEKSYDYTKRVIASFKEDAGKVAGLSTKVQTLEQQIADGKGNEAIAQQLTDTKQKLEEAQGLLTTKQQAWETEKAGYETNLSKIQVQHQFDAATKGLKFKPEYPENIQTTLINSAKETLLSKYKTDFIDDGKGGKQMVFRDEKGVIQNNPENQLNPYTAEELIKVQLKDVLGEQRKAAGGGGENPKPALGS